MDHIFSCYLDDMLANSLNLLDDFEDKLFWLGTPEDLRPQ